jgi:indole-3-glycerol phosphate synthase
MKAEAQGGGTLRGILAEAARRVAMLRRERRQLERRAAEAATARPFAAALRGADVGLVAEIKRRSPSSGVISAHANAVGLARLYAGAGARAISVLTEERHFGGSLRDLVEVSAAVSLPVLRKDFIVDPLQVFEARAAGASAILLIVRVLAEDRLVSLAALAREIGLETLVEVHGPDELERALAVRPDAVGINARDLETLAMDHALVTELLPRVPATTIAVAESGVRTRADVERVGAAGADAVLVGTAVAGAANPADALRGLVGVSAGWAIRERSGS